MPITFHKPPPQDHHALGLNTPAEAADMLGGYKPETLKTWRWRGVGPRVVHLGKKKMYTDEALADYVKSLEREPGASDV